MTEFKSRICTTVEQSKRLLGLGLKPETADCCYYYYDGEYFIAFAEDAKYPSDIPAWSLWRLIEMLPPSIKDGYHYSLIYDIHRYLVGYMCYSDGISRYTNRFLWDTQSTNPFDNIINCIEWLIKEGYFNKKYLKEENS